MSYYTEYMNKGLLTGGDIGELSTERKRVLQEISAIRGGRDVLVIAGNLSNRSKIVSPAIDYDDLISVHDQLDNLNGDALDVILETPGGVGQVVEDIVRLIRSKYERVGIIVPGYAKSAGTIFAMAGDEILMGPISALGPIDAQIPTRNGYVSAHGFLQGFEKIKNEADAQKKLNLAYIPMLQQITPGDIQHWENQQEFAKKLVREWLVAYKFKYWERHSSNGQQVTEEEKRARAHSIAEELSSSSRWFTHGRSLRIVDIQSLGVKVTDFSADRKLYEMVMRYYALMKITFDTNIYKIYETPTTQIFKFENVQQPGQPGAKASKMFQQIPPPALFVEFHCKHCEKNSIIQVNLREDNPALPDTNPFPISNNKYSCPYCGVATDLAHIRNDIESKQGLKFY